MLNHNDQPLVEIGKTLYVIGSFRGTFDLSTNEGLPQQDWGVERARPSAPPGYVDVEDLRLSALRILSAPRCEGRGEEKVEMSFRDSVADEARTQDALRAQKRPIPAHLRRYARLAGLGVMLTCTVGSILRRA